MWYSRGESDTTQQSPDQCYLSLHAILFDLISKFLDFHDLSLLLQTGDALLRHIILERPRSVTMTSPLELNHGCDTPFLPRDTFTILSAFQQLETLVLTSSSWRLPSYQESFLLKLPSSLRHLTIEATQPDNESVSVLMLVPWSTKFPTLETLRLSIENDGHDLMPRLGRYLNADSLPKSLRVLSLLVDLLLDREILMKRLLHPIGYNIDTTLLNSESTKSWTEAWNLHSEPSRKSFTYTLPNLEFLELPSEVNILDGHQGVTNLPDLAVLPPSLHTLIYRNTRSFNSKTVHMTKLLSDEELKAPPTGTVPSSALTTLGVAGMLPFGWLERSPPTITRLMLTKPSKDTDLGSLFPHLRELKIWTGSYATARDINSVPIALANITSCYKNEMEVGSAIAPLVDDSEPTPYNLPIKTLRKLAIEYHTGSIDRLSQGFNQLTNLTFLSTEVLTFDYFFPRLPLTLTCLIVTSHKAPILLESIPPALKTLVLHTTDSMASISASQLSKLPSNLRYCRLPPIRIHEKKQSVTASEIALLLASLPKKCTYALSLFCGSPKNAKSREHVPLSTIVEATKGTAMHAPHRFFRYM